MCRFYSQLRVHYAITLKSNEIAAVRLPTPTIRPNARISQRAYKQTGITTTTITIRPMPLSANNYARLQGIANITGRKRTERRCPSKRTTSVIKMVKTSSAHSPAMSVHGYNNTVRFQTSRMQTNTRIQDKSMRQSNRQTSDSATTTKALARCIAMTFGFRRVHTRDTDTKSKNSGLFRLGGGVRYLQRRLAAMWRIVVRRTRLCDLSACSAIHTI